MQERHSSFNDRVRHSALFAINGNDTLASIAAFGENKRSFVTIHKRILGVAGDQPNMDRAYVSDGIPHLLRRGIDQYFFSNRWQKITLLELIIWLLLTGNNQNM